MMAGILVSPGFDKIVRNRSASYKKKGGGSPSFRDVLRQRCKDRFKAKRCALLNQFRNINCNEEVKDIICSMVREEALVLTDGLQYNKSDDVEMDTQPLEEGTLNNFEDWLLEEYDRIMEEQMARDIDLCDQSICPLCLSSPLLDECETYSTCKSCCVKLPPLCIISPSLDYAYEQHSSTGCNELPSCSILDNSLCLFCSECTFIISIIELTS